VADGAGHQAIDYVDLGAGQPRGFRMTAGQLALVLEQQIAHARTSSASVVGVGITLAFHFSDIISYGYFSLKYM